jgi:putative ABC transport system ATP-binding protein
MTVAQGGASVTLRDLAKTYRTAAGVTVPALAGVSLDIQPGEVVAVTAPSGAGKSTLLHVLGAMDAPDSGTITVDSIVVTALSRKEQVQYRQTVGFVFQRFHLLPALNAIDNVVAPVMPYRTSFDKTSRGAELLAAVGLGDRLDAFPAQLSGGQQQRVAIARSLVNEPRLLLADEPTGNLDSATGKDILDLLLRLNTDRGMTVVLATHDPAVAARCGRTIRLLDGRIMDG